ncbi:hypothetical protein GCM10018772_23560 [Streptomyces fumanus]|uniref:Transposase IS4-like domain-containing protein n=1 Tax=Streptomyces fumanus TaxID=67302 RepID=A0A919ACY9_9ACTN|nr:hypothetical protein GCM10018772_23560 [Streptomyces fumanus]
MPGVITASEPSWTAPFTGLSPCHFGELLTALRREGADPVRKGPTNLTLRQLGPLFGIAKSASDRIINHLGPSLALLPRKRFRKDTVLIVDGTLVPTRDHTIAEQSKNYRYSTNYQVVVDADPRLVVAVGRPLPGNRNDCKAWELPGAKDAVGRTTVIADGSYRGTSLAISTAVSAARPNSPPEGANTTRPPQGPLPRRALLGPREGVEDPPRLPPERRRRPPRHARHRPPAQPHPGRITEKRAGQSARRRSFAEQLFGRPRLRRRRWTSGSRAIPRA